MPVWVEDTPRNMFASISRSLGNVKVFEYPVQETPTAAGILGPSSLALPLYSFLR